MSSVAVASRSYCIERGLARLMMCRWDNAEETEEGGEWERKDGVVAYRLSRTSKE